MNVCARRGGFCAEFPGLRPLAQYPVPPYFVMVAEGLFNSTTPNLSHSVMYIFALRQLY